MPITWHEFSTAIEKADGRIDMTLVSAFATQRALAEHAKCRAMGWNRPLLEVLAEEHTLVLTTAQTVRDNLIARQELAKLRPHERATRSIDLDADLAETSIPPRRCEVISLRARAAQMRAAGRPVRLVAAE